MLWSGLESYRRSWRRPALSRLGQTQLRCTMIPRLWYYLRGPRAMRGRRRGDSRADNGMGRLRICLIICTFCIIPQLRGQFRSRRFESVVAEAERLARSGVREITLIGQDTTCYGEDFGLKDGLALLLEKLAKIEDLRWIRFLYAYPNKITGKLLDTIASSEKICS